VFPSATLGAGTRTHRGHSAIQRVPSFSIEPGAEREPTFATMESAAQRLEDRPHATVDVITARN